MSLRADLHWIVSTRVLMPDLLLDLPPLITEIFRCFSAGTWKCIGGWEDFLGGEIISGRKTGNGEL